MRKKSDVIFYLTQTPENVLATHALATESIKKIIAQLPPSSEEQLPPYMVWISQEEDLHDFVYQIPELAWDMLEYAEEPLEILYPQRKFISPLQEESQEPISIRLVRGPKLQAFVRKHGPLLCFRLPDNYSPPTLIDQEHHLKESGNQFNKVKSMKLFPDGSFTFVR